MSLQKLGIAAGSIWTVYLISNVFLQKLYLTKYPSSSNPHQSHYFHHPTILVAIESLICGIFGSIRGRVTQERQNPIPSSLCFLLGFLYTVHILAANFALLYIPYPMQVVGMNCRYIMVVFVGVYFSRVLGTKDKLKAKKIIIAFIATVGAVSFTVFKDDFKTESEAHLDPTKSWIGYVLVFSAVFSDAFFLDNQAYAKYKFQPTANHLLTSANLYTVFFCIIVALIRNTLMDELIFCLDHPKVLIDILILSALQSLGQVAIYFLITNFKQHIFPLVAMVRKIMTIILSAAIFGHRFNSLQYLSLAVVFGALASEVLEEFVFQNKAPSTQIITKKQFDQKKVK